MTFSSGKCVISNDCGDTIGQVPCSSQVVYKVVHNGPEPMALVVLENNDIKD